MEGQRVMARFKASSMQAAQLSSTRWFPANVLRLHEDGRCDVSYDDRVREDFVLPQHVRVLSESKALASIIFDGSSETRGHWKRTVDLGPRYQADVARWAHDGDVAPAETAAASDGVGVCDEPYLGSLVQRRSLETAHALALARTLTAAAYGEDPSDEVRLNRERGYTEDV